MRLVHNDMSLYRLERCLLDGIDEKLRDRRNRVLSNFYNNLTEVVFIRFSGQWVIKFDEVIDLALLIRMCHQHPRYLNHPGIQRLGVIIHDVSDDDVEGQEVEIENPAQGGNNEAPVLPVDQGYNSPN